MSLLSYRVNSQFLILSLLLQLGAFLVACHDANSISAEAEGDTNLTKNGVQSTVELPQPLLEATRKQRSLGELELHANATAAQERDQRSSRRPTLMDIALQASAREGLNAMTELYGRIEPEIVKNGQLLEDNHPAALLSKFSESVEDSQHKEMAAFATISAAKAFRKNYKYINDFGRQAHSQKISLRRTALEGLCPPRDPPLCMPATERYRTHDGTCNNKRRLRWGAAQMPFNRFLPPEYGDGVDSIRNSVESGPLSSSRFVSLLVHGARDGEAPLTLMTAQWGQLLDHDLTSTAQPRSINGSVPSCCGGKDFHPSCFPIKVPLDDPWLAPLKVRCLEFLRSAPAQRRDCVLSWREQTNQATSFIDASPIYSNSARSSDNARVFRNGLLVYGRGNPAEDVCQRGAIATQCIRAGDGRSGEQPGLLALHHVWVGEHNRIAMELSEINQHWSDEKIFQETRRIVGAMFQHITYREFLPIVLGREVCKLFDLDLLNTGYFVGYDHKVNPTVANSFAAAAFRFGHSLIQNSYMRCDRHHNVINNNVSLHEEFQRGDIGSAGSLHRLLRGLATQRALKRDEFITPELTNHLFQTPGFPFGLDLAAINIQRGRDHGIAPYTSWRIPCGLTPIDTWDDFVNVVGPESANRIGHAYRSVHDIDLFVGGIAERPVVGGLVGPTFACIIAQQFSNSRKGDRFWYENGGFESSFTPAQLHSLRRVSLAQVLCRAVGGGTFQPHIFIPSGFPGNKRVSCGVDPLAAIDLNPWLEQDPFAAAPQTSTATFETQIPERVFDIISTDLNTNTLSILKEDKAGFSNRIKPTKNISLPLTHAPQVDFMPNASTGFQRPKKNSTKVNDKLDIRRKTGTSKRPALKPISGVHNKLDKGGTRVTLNIKGVNQRRRPQTTTRRTVVVNNIPIELRNAAGDDKDIDTKNNTNIIEQKTETETNNLIKTTTTNPKDKTKTDKPKLPRVDDKTQQDELSISIVTDIPSTENTATEETPTDDEAVEEDVDSATVDEADIFDIFSILTEPTISTTENILITPTDSATNNDKLSVVSREKTNSRRGKLENTKSNYQIDHKTDREDNVSFRQKAKSMQLNNRDNSDIDPMTHSTAVEHKRVQRKLDTKKLIHKKSDSLNATGITVRNSLANSTTVTEHSIFRTFHKNRTISTTTPRTIQKHTKTTPRTVELRQYQTIPNYTRPQKVIVAGPNADQYEIEINIRQTNKSPPARPVTNYADYTTIYKPYGIDRYSSNYADYSSTQAYYQQPSNLPQSSLGQGQRTKPPTVIYLNEHDERTTTRQPGLLQNFITFATNGFSGNRKPFPHGQTSQNEKPAFESVTSSSASAFGRPHNSALSVSSASSPHYIPRPQTQSQQSQLQLPIASSSFSQVGGYPGGAGGGVGQVHASSGAVSSGSFGQITAVASANGADSIFSFNIRPRPSLQNHAQTLAAARPDPAGYGLLPPRQPSYGQLTSPDYLNLPQNDQYHGIPHRESENSPFSTAHKRPQSQSYYSRTQTDPQQKDITATQNNLPTPADHKLVFHDYDYLSRTLEPRTNNTSEEEVDDKDDEEYLYDDLVDDENIASGKIFDRDGYLRPQHMTGSLYKAKESPVTNETNKNSTLLDDNYVLPMLDTSQLQLPLTNMPKPIQTLADDVTTVSTENATDDFPDVVGKHFNNDIQAEDYEDDLTEPFIMSKTAALTAMKGTKRPVAVSMGKLSASPNMVFAPIQILTKPERPDNWVYFEAAKEKPLLPELPQFNVDSVPTDEVPMPIQSLTNAWLTKFNSIKEGDAFRIEARTETATDGKTNAPTEVTNFEDVLLSDVTTGLPQLQTLLKLDQETTTTTMDAFTEQPFQTNDKTTTESIDLLPTRPGLNRDKTQAEDYRTGAKIHRAVEGA